MIELRGVEREDLEQFKHWRNLPELRQYFREYRELNSQHQESWFNSLTSDRSQIVFSIHRRKSETDNITLYNNSPLIGCCGLHNISWVNRSAEFGIYIGLEFQKNGYAKDSMLTLLSYGFNELYLNRIWGEVYSNNPALDFYKHLGFCEEGRLRQTYYFHGWHDSHIISILRSEFLS